MDMLAPPPAPLSRRISLQLMLQRGPPVITLDVITVALLEPSTKEEERDRGREGDGGGSGGGGGWWMWWVVAVTMVVL